MTSRIHDPSVRITGDGHPWLGDTVWDDFVVDAHGLRLGPANNPGFDQLFGTVVRAWHFQWNAANPEELFFEAQLPHRWKPTTTVYPHVHWAIPVAGAGGGVENVQWDMDYMVQDVGNQYPAGVTNITTAAVDVQNDPVRQKFLTEIGAGITMAGLEESCVFACRVRRLVSIGNDYQNDVALLSVDFHIEIEKMGTAQRNRPYTP